MTAFVVLLAHGWGPTAGMTGLALAAFAAGCAGLWLVRPWRGLGRASRRDAATWTGADLAAWLRYGGSHDGLLFMIPVANLCLVKTMVADPGEVAVYIACFVAARATAALGIISAGMLFAPTARAVSRNEVASVRSFLATAVRVQVLLLAPLVALAPLRGPDLLQMAGGFAHRPSGVMLGTLLASGALLTMWAFVGEMLAAAGHLRGRLSLAVGLVTIGLPCMAVATYVGYSQGAAAGMLAVAAFGATGSMLVAQGAFGWFLPWGSVLWTIAAAGAAAWVLPVTAFPGGVVGGVLDVAVRSGIFVGLVVAIPRLRFGLRRRGGMRNRE